MKTPVRHSVPLEEIGKIMVITQPWSKECSTDRQTDRKRPLIGYLICKFGSLPRSIRVIFLCDFFGIPCDLYEVPAAKLQFELQRRIKKNRCIEPFNTVYSGFVYGLSDRI